MATLDDAIAQMRAAGLPALPDGHPKTNGKVHRFGEKKKCWYVLHEFVLKSGRIAVAGAFGEWQGNNSNTVKIETDWKGVSAEERADLERRQRELQQREDEKRAHQAKTAAQRAAMQWNAAAKEGEAPYVRCKQITAPGLRYLPDGTLLVPMMVMSDGQPVLVGLQKIMPDGEKRFNKGMAKAGAFMPTGKPAPEDRIMFLAEGYATGRTVRMATDDSLAGRIAFDAGNLLEVARAMRAEYPDVHILFCADDDYLLEPRMRRDLREMCGIELECDVPIDGKEHAVVVKAETYRVTATYKSDEQAQQYIELKVLAPTWNRTLKYENAGLAKAHAAAAAVGNASVTWPRFTNRVDQPLTDWNDLHCTEGLDACKAQLSAAILSALTPESVKERVAEQERVDAQQQGNVVELRPKKKKSKSTASKAAAEGGETPPPEPPDGDAENGALRWEAHLARSDKGFILPTLNNVYQILVNNKEWEGVIAYEEFSGHVIKLKPPPYANSKVGEWEDMDDLRTTLWMQQKYGFHPQKMVVMEAVLLAADMRSEHVVRTYLKSLTWDGTERLTHWLIDKLGVEDKEFVRRISRKWMIGAVARIFKPGAKVDNVLILEGAQGRGKSTALKVLGGEWFTDAPLRFGDKDSYIIMRGMWIIELAELDSFNKAESEAAKQFFGQYEDRYRNFYGKRASNVPRQQVFAGTTNKGSYLKDETGNRRYWPALVGEIDIEGLRAMRDQLWAEAVAAYLAGEPWWETPDDVELFKAEVEDRYVNDAYSDLIAKGLIGQNEITLPEVMGDILKLDVSKWTMAEQQRVARALVKLGWVRKRVSKAVNPRRPWHYVRQQDDDEAEHEKAARVKDGPL
jgi:predicted P-loop ATPase/phage/plasmid primase-like uncharacterized protein